MCVLRVGNNSCFINQEFGRILLLNVFFDCFRRFTCLRQKEVSAQFKKMGYLEWGMAAVLSVFGAPIFIVASVAISAAFLNGISGAVCCVPTSDGRRIYRVSELKCNIVNVCRNIFRPRSRSNARRRRSATRVSSATGGNAADGDGSSSDSCDHYLCLYFPYLLKKSHIRTNLSKRLAHKHSSLKACSDLCARLRFGKEAA